MSNGADLGFDIGQAIGGVGDVAGAAGGFDLSGLSDFFTRAADIPFADFAPAAPSFDLSGVSDFFTRAGGMPFPGGAPWSMDLSTLSAPTMPSFDWGTAAPEAPMRVGGADIPPAVSAAGAGPGSPGVASLLGAGPGGGMTPLEPVEGGAGGGPPPPDQSDLLARLFGTSGGEKGIVGGIATLAGGVKDAASLYSMYTNAQYQKRRADYDKAQLAMQQGLYGAELDYLQQRHAYEGQLMDLFNQQYGSFSDALAQYQADLAGFQDQATQVFNQQMGMATSMAQQSGELTGQGAAMLLQGQVPPGLQPVVNDLRNKWLAAANQSAATQGGGPGQAAIIADVDQRIQGVLANLGQTVTQLGQAGMQQALSALGGAGQTVGTELATAAAGLDPLAKLLGLSQQGLIALLSGGQPSVPIATGGPTPPTA